MASWANSSSRIYLLSPGDLAQERVSSFQSLLIFLGQKDVQLDVHRIRVLVAREQTPQALFLSDGVVFIPDQDTEVNIAILIEFPPRTTRSG